jgi:hypothetical protein
LAYVPEFPESPSGRLYRELRTPEPRAALYVPSLPAISYTNQYNSRPFFILSSNPTLFPRQKGQKTT